MLMMNRMRRGTNQTLTGSYSLVLGRDYGRLEGGDGLGRRSLGLVGGGFSE